MMYLLHNHDTLGGKRDNILETVQDQTVLSLDASMSALILSISLRQAHYD